MKKFLCLLLVLMMCVLTACTPKSVNSVSSAWIVGETSPDDNVGNKSDLYLNTKTYDIYQKTSSSWKLIGNIQGPAGANGNDGQTGEQGLPGKNGLPGEKGDPGTNGNDGRTPIFRVSEGVLQWKYEGDNLWNDLAVLSGTATATSWLVGNKTPNNENGVKGDMYLNINTYDLYQKGESSWSLLCNIKGLTGETGPQGPQGETGATGPQGATGATGPQGATGATGPQGPQGAKGEAGDDGKTPVLRMSDKKLQWQYSGDETWTDLIEIIDGTDGEKGNDGDDGSIWFTGKGAPTGISAKANDLYLDSESCDVYKYSTSWDFVANIRGAQGATGATGPQGATGATGPQGATGATGPQGETGAAGNDGEDGRTPELRVYQNMLQWKYTDDEEWIDLIEIITPDDLNNKPKPVIFDTDFWTDTDDLSAIRILLWAEQEGMCDIVGLIVDAVHSRTAETISKYLDYEGRGDLPVAIEKNATDYDGTPKYINSLCSWPYGMYSSNDDAEDEGEGNYYVKLLQNVPEGEKCNIICVGYLNSIAGLINQAKDSESIKNLLETKVDKIYVMAGKYPSGSENNMTRTARSRKAAYDFCENVPASIPVIFLGYEAGVDVRSGNTTGEKIGSFDLLYKAMVDHGNQTTANSSWDPMLTLLALYDDPEAAGYKLVQGTNKVNKSTGANTFTKNTTGNHYYVTKKYPDGWYAHNINTILERIAWPHRETGRVQYEPIKEEYLLNSITVTQMPKTTYFVGQSFDPTGMVVKANLTGKTSGDTYERVIFAYDYSTEPFNTTGEQQFTISYTEGEVTKTYDIDLLVKVPQEFTITRIATHGSISGDTTISEGSTVELTLTPEDTYVNPKEITVEGATYTYDPVTGLITLSEPTENVTISAICVIPEPKEISVSVTNGTYVGPETITTSATITITANTNYILPTTITVTGASYTWNKETGIITLSNATDDVSIKVVCSIESLDLDNYIAIVLDGSEDENWAFNSATPNPNGYYNCYLINSSIVPAANTVATTSSYATDAFCSWGPDWKNNEGGSRDTQNNRAIGYYTNDPSIYFRFQSDIATTPHGFAEYLQEHPVTLYLLKKGCQPISNYTITSNIANGTYTGETSIRQIDTVNAKIVANANHKLPETIEVDGATYTYNKSTGDITLSNPTKNVTINATCVADDPATGAYSITVNVTNGTYVSSATSSDGEDVIVTITPSSGYDLPENVSTTGATVSYNSTTGVITLSSISQNIVLNITCPKTSDYIAVTFNGTENWQFNTSGEPNANGYYNCYLIDDNYVPKSTDIQLMAKTKSSRAKSAYCSNSYWTNQTTTTDRSAENGPCFGYYVEGDNQVTGNSIYFRFNSDIATSVESFKEYLSKNNLTLYFLKAEN